MRKEDVPFLKGYMTFPEAADYLGVTNQGIHDMVWVDHQFRSVVRVGNRPTYLLKTTEVEHKRIARDAVVRSKTIPAAG
jgi:hypothetical protein